MEGSPNTRRLALALRHTGYVLVAISLCALLLRSGAASALAQIVPVPTQPQPTAQPSALPSSSPVAAGTPDRSPHTLRGGPINFSLTGALTLGERSTSSQFGDDSTPGGPIVTSQSEGANNAGLLLQAARRTPLTTLTFGIPIGVSSGQRTSFGQAQLSYYTPHYGLQYMPQALAALGVVPLGSTLEGLTLTLPLHGGDLAFIGGSTSLGVNASAARVYGVRARQLSGRKLFELGYYHAATNDGLQSADTLVGGFANANDSYDQIFEGALQRNRTPWGSFGAAAFQYRFDYGSSTTYSTVTLLHQSDNFASMGGGMLQADDRASLGFRASQPSGSISLDAAVERAGDGDGRTSSEQSSLLYTRSWGRTGAVTSALTLTGQRSSGFFGNVYVGGAGLQIGANANGLSTILGIQETRSTATYGAPLSLSTYQGTVQKQLGDVSAQVSYQYSRQLTEGSFTRLGATSVSVSRQWGATALTLSDTFSHTVSPVSNAVQTTPLITLSRRISPVTIVGLNFGEQTSRDALNPSSNGRTRIFGIQISTPFAFGNGIVQGRPNPHLPATIAGAVVSDFGNEGPLSGAINTGIGNVMVVLDNSVVQRTDLSGHYQFNFVPPGHHTVQLDLSSLPRGVTPDQPIAAVDVQGGQQGSVYFQVGTYGAVTGNVMARQTDGRLVPIPGVALTIDGSGFATTAPDGSFAFGKLSAGTHTVAVQVATLPATVNFPSQEATQKIVVQNGQIAKLDFVANPLGSIAGKLVYDATLAPQFSGGVLNAYVVAEPGDFAAITDEDGAFVLDNLPPGNYTIDVDPDTVPDDTGNVSGAQTIDLHANEHLDGLSFTIGHKIKPVVFSIKSVETPASLVLRDPVLPPGGATEATVEADGAQAVRISAMGQNTQMHYDDRRKKWVGTVIVPPNTSARSATIIADVTGKHTAEASADLKIDSAMPIATFQMTPRNPSRGQYVTVRARFLADVHPGDRIRWLDGQLTKLGNPITGRVYEFTVKISEQPMHGELLTRQGRLPILLR